MSSPRAKTVAVHTQQTAGSMTVSQGCERSGTRHYSSSSRLFSVDIRASQKTEAKREWTPLRKHAKQWISSAVSTAVSPGARLPNTRVPGSCVENKFEVETRWSRCERGCSCGGLRAWHIPRLCQLLVFGARTQRRRRQSEALDLVDQLNFDVVLTNIYLKKSKNQMDTQKLRQSF